MGESKKKTVAEELNRLAIKTTACFGVVIISLLLIIAGYAFQKIEVHDVQIASNAQEIAILKSKEASNISWKRSIDAKLERVVYK